MSCSEFKNYNFTNDLYLEIEKLLLKISTIQHITLISQYLSSKTFKN